jgi:hypothetical protein
MKNIIRFEAETAAGAILHNSFWSMKNIINYSLSIHGVERWARIKNVEDFFLKIIGRGSMMFWKTPKGESAFVFYNFDCIIVNKFLPLKF